MFTAIFPGGKPLHAESQDRRQQFRLCYDMNENWQDDPYSGDSAIEVRVKTNGSPGRLAVPERYLPRARPSRN
jgi:hypothetical protein